jgi:hypothetical protein
MKLLRFMFAYTHIADVSLLFLMCLLAEMHN